jgi:ribosomal protein S18 acetylase RimI-like enzyme
MIHSPNIRIAHKDDLKQIINLLIDDKLGKTREDLSYFLEYQKAFNAILSDQNHIILVMEKSDTIIGCIQLSYIPNLTFKGSLRAQLEGVRISSKHRGKGLGKMLITEAIKQAKARGCKIIQLTTNNNRPDAIAFYESLGFKKTHVGMKLYYEN